MPHRTALAALRSHAGKTLQTISVLWTLLRQGPVANGLSGGAECVNAIVISPTSLVLNWKAEVPQRGATGHAAAHRSGGPAACSGLPCGPAMGARTAWMPKTGYSGALVPAHSRRSHQR